MDNKLKLAVLDMNEGRPNQGMRCIRDITAIYGSAFDIDEFDVRAKHELPDLSYDVYISSGGPGNPLEGDGIWDKAWYELIGNLWQHNLDNKYEKKYVFFICHSFQMACNFFDIASVLTRKSTSFGVMPIHLTTPGVDNPVFKNLPNPFYAVDSRDYQVIHPDLDVLTLLGAEILALEKVRHHIDLERAIMAVKFSEEFIGTQFHPEADPIGMRIHFERSEIRKAVIENYTLDKYNDMMVKIEDPDKLELTHNTILPAFIENSLDAIFKNNYALV